MTDDALSALARETMERILNGWGWSEGDRKRASAIIESALSQQAERIEAEHRRKVMAIRAALLGNAADEAHPPTVELAASLRAELEQARQDAALQQELVQEETGRTRYFSDELQKLRANELELAKQLSRALTGGNAETWDEICHAAEQAERALEQAREKDEKNGN